MLCLSKIKQSHNTIHGYRQNGEIFRQKTGSFRKIVHKWAEFTYVTAPHKVIQIDDMNQLTDIDVGQSKDDEQYGWFFNREDKTFRGIRKGGPAIGFEESVAFIEKICEEEGPFDGIFGFSQGACFVGLLCDLQYRGLIVPRFKFAIMASGFRSGSLEHLKYFAESISLPSLHIYGMKDKIISSEMSEELAEGFVNAHIEVHEGGHYVSTGADQKKAYQAFIRGMHDSIFN